MNRSSTLSLVCCLIAFALGTLTLGWRNVWGDEAFAVWASKQSVLALWRSLDNSPPGYYLSLKLGRAVWGESVFAVRFASVCFGVVWVALAARLGGWLGGVRGAEVCALFVALAPMTSYFEQEARMYTQALMLCAAAMLLTLRTMQRGARARYFVALVVVSVLALFTHLYSIAILAVNALALLVAAWRSSNRAAALRGWGLVQGAMALIYGAWFLAFQLAVLRAEAGARSTAPLLPPLRDWSGYAARGITGLLFGVRAEAWLAPIAMAAFVFLALGALFLWRPALQRSWGWLVGGWIALPIVLALMTAALVPEFSPRYFLFALLPLALAASGWAQVGRDGKRGARWLARVPLAAIVLGTSVYGNAALFDGRWDKSQYREALQTVRTQSKPTDALVLVNSDQFPMHDFYGPTDIETILISNEPRQATQNQANFEALLQTKRRIWLLNYGAAIAWNTPFEQRLNATALRVYAGDFSDASLALYDLSGGDGGEIQPREAVFGDGIRLIGTRIRTPQLAPGSTLALDLFWQANQKLRADYTVFVHVRRAADGVQIAANDSPPVNGAAPTSGWPIGQVITDARGVAIPDDAAPGAYNVYVGLYEYPSFERLTLAGTARTEFVVGQVRIEP